MPAESSSSEEFVSNTSALEEAGIDICECGSTDLIKDQTRAEIICRNCGLVLSDHLIDYRKERRSFSTEERNLREHTGSPLTNLLPDMGLSTKIDNNTNLTARNKQKFQRLKKWQNRQTWHQKNLSIAMNEIRRICSQLHLPEYVNESAATLYRKVYKKDLLKGRSIKSMVAAAVYIICRQNNVPLPLKSITNLSLESEKTIRKAYRTILQELNLKVNSVDAMTLISRIGGELKITNKIEKDAQLLIEKAKENKLLVGKDPKGIAAAAIYIASIQNGKRRSQTSVAKAANVTEVTLRNRYKELVEI
ncbi:MAG: transcription initiation factor IIB [Candidatus Lokiarchaeota archaeon]|nr:transcription initiation factor IIB [Candidatus Lokiarchaeota archaeon]